MVSVADMLLTLRRHWRHYLTEAAGLAVFVAVSGGAAVVFHHPVSAVARALGPQWVQRIGLGVVMGALVAALSYSPWGRRSGAHLNPAVTLGFWQLGHVQTVDALWYGLAQFSGALAASAAMARLLGPWFGHSLIHYNTTRPLAGPHGWAVALVAETVISALLMLALLVALHSARLKKWAGALVGALLAVFIVVEAPLSGMSLNPARTLGTAVAAGQAPALWLYFVGPLVGMWGTAWGYGRYRRHRYPAARPPQYPEPDPG
ncbi:aquaporin [Hymenobacter antarcticus]|uniref:Aquaporin n=1 Tax=Hymenobacter antarcticus TaxID=486270 RepID=A0ABP7QB52_9BACT